MNARTVARLATASLLMGLSLGAPSLAGAHHGFTNNFDPDAEITIEGAVTDFRFINPHVLIRVDVQTSSGETQHWLVESAGVSSFLRDGGLTAESLAPGDRVRVIGYPARDGGHAVRLKVIVFPNGDKLERESPYQAIPFAEREP